MSSVTTKHTSLTKLCKIEMYLNLKCLTLLPSMSFTMEVRMHLLTQAQYWYMPTTWGVTLTKGKMINPTRQRVCTLL